MMEHIDRKSVSPEKHDQIDSLLNNNRTYFLTCTLNIQIDYFLGHYISHNN